MFVLTNNVSAAMKVIATLLATAVVMWTIGFYATAEAANITNYSDTLSDSAPSASADHLIVFDTSTDIQIAETLTVTFPVAAGEFDLTGVTTGDFDISDPGNWTEAAPAAGVVTFTRTNSVLAGGTTVTINFNGANKIANPSDPTSGNESYEIDIAGTMADSGHTRVVILDTVLVTAIIQTVFDFTVNGLLAGVDVNGIASTLPSSSTTIPFGVLDADDDEVIAQNLTVKTNAINGFVVTVETDGEFKSSTGAEIDGFVMNSDTNVPTAWSGAVTDIANPTTWGHWGLSSTDNDAADSMRTGAEFAADEWIAATTSPREIFAHDGPSDGVTDNVGSTTIGYRVEVTALQEAGDDYSTTLTYIATPTF